MLKSLLADRRRGFRQTLHRAGSSRRRLVHGLLGRRPAMRQHILVVDDELQIRELLTLYLMRQGYQVSSAATSAETEECLMRSAVDLVVLDIGLQGEDGLDLLVSLKARYPETRVIMLTGMGFVEDLLEEAHAKGADGYVSKVLPLDELLMAIQRALGSEPALVPA